jgi:hypothetical protein
VTASTATDPLWRVVLDTGRLGDWIHVHAADAEAAVGTLTRTRRKQVRYVRRVFKSSEIRSLVESGEKPVEKTFRFANGKPLTAEDEAREAERKTLRRGRA